MSGGDSSNGDLPWSFEPALSDLGRSLLSPPAATRQELQTCVLTLLRILDNVIGDPSRSNPKLRKIKVANPAFRKRAGRWEGSVAFLSACGFAPSGKAEDSGGGGGVPSQLRLEGEDSCRLLAGRVALVRFSTETLGMEERILPGRPVGCAAPVDGVAGRGGRTGMGSAAGAGGKTEIQRVAEADVVPVASVCTKKEGPASETTGPTSPSASSDRKPDTFPSTMEDADRVMRWIGGVSAPDSTSVPVTRLPDTEGDRRTDGHNKGKDNSTGQKSSSLSREADQLQHPRDKQEKIQQQQQKEQHQQEQKPCTKKNISALISSSPTNEKMALPEQKIEISQPLAVPKTLSIEEIQALARRDREESLVEKKRLEQEQEEEKLRASKTERRRSTAVAADGALAESTKTLPGGSKRRENKQTEKIDPRDNEEDQSRRMDRQRVAAALSSPTDSAQKGASVAAASPAPDAPPPSLADEMTDLLDEIESELNGSFFGGNDGTDHDVARGGVSIDGQTAASVCAREAEVRLSRPAEIEMAECGSGPITTEDVAESEVLENIVEGRVRLERTRIKGGVEDVMDIESDVTDSKEEIRRATVVDAVDTDGVAAANQHGNTEPRMRLPEALEELVSGGGSASSPWEAIAPSTHGGVSLLQNGEESGSGQQIGGVAGNVTGRRRSRSPQPEGLCASASDLLIGLSEAEINPNGDDESNWVTLSTRESLPVRKLEDGVPPQDIAHSDRGELSETARESTAPSDVSGNGDSVLQSGDDDGYATLFHSIQLPEGEEEADAVGFRRGFELCHRVLLSVWQPDPEGSVEAARSLPEGATNPPSTTMAGLSKFREWIDGKAESASPDNKAAIIVPQAFVYAAWAHILGLDDADCSDDMPGDGVQSGKMYAWTVSNDPWLGKLEDVATAGDSLSHILPESCVAVCNYVSRALRSVGLINIYRARLKRREDVSSEEFHSFFIGVNSKVLDECLHKNEGDLLGKPVLHECHAVLAQRVGTIPYELATAASADIDVRILLWYACHHAARHLTLSDQIEDAKSLLLDGAYIQLRLQTMGPMAGTAAHSRDCARISGEVAPSDARHWREDNFRILCAVSAMLREEAVEAAEDTESSRKRKVQNDVGDALRLVGERIGDAGAYRSQEMECYEEALRLKSDARGDGHESVGDILYVMGRHHQRYRHFKFAQKCYEQALRVYRTAVGSDHVSVAKVLHNIGIMYHARGDSDTALKCLRKSLAIRLDSQTPSSGKDGAPTDHRAADTYCWIGKIHREERDLARSREFFIEAHRIRVAALGKAHVDSAEALQNVGVVCDDLGLNSQSLTCFREALLIRLANVSGTNDIEGINDVCETLDCIANVYRVKGQNQKALQFFDQCLKRRLRLVSFVAATSPSDKTQVLLLLRTYEDVIALMKLQAKGIADKDEISGKVGTLLVEMGSLYDQRLNKQPKALVYLQKALQTFQQMKDYAQIGNTLSMIGVIHVKKSSNRKALKCFRDSLVMRKMSTKKENSGMAETWHNIGNCEARDGHFEDSLRSYEEALVIKRKIFTSSHVSIAKTEHCMGLALLQLGNLDEALKCFENSMKVRRELLGNGHLDVAFSLHSLGRIYFHQKKEENAIDCLEDALEIKQAKLPEKHMSLAETQHLLGSLYNRKKKFACAVPLLKSALVAYRSSRGDCEIIKSDVLDLLGNAYAQVGEKDHALLSYEHSLKIKKVLVGKDHVACANVSMEIGKLKSQKEDIDGALFAFKEVKRIQKILYGTNHLRNSDLLIQVGLIQDRLNNNETALRCFAEALRMRRKLLSKNHRSIAEALVHTGRMHQSKGDHYKSLGFFQQAIDIYRESDGDAMSPECAYVCRLLGLSQIASGDNENALTSLERCLEVRESTYGKKSEQWAEAAYDLGIAKHEAGFYDDSVKLLDRFVHLQKSFETHDSERVSKALLLLGKIYLKKRSIDNAMVYFDEALEMRKKMSNNELGVSEILFQIGNVRESKKQYLESLVCYEESLKLRLSVSGEDEVTADVLSRIGEVRRIRGQHDLALENFTLAMDMYKSTVGEAHLSVAKTYHSLGYVCDAQADIQKAMQNHKEGLSVRKLILGGDHVKVAASLDDVAGMYQKQNQQKKALKCLKEALRIRKLQLGNDDIEIGKTLFGMGIIFSAIRDNEKAAECYNASLDISSRVGTNPKLEAQTLHQIGCMHAADCNYREALSNWRTCLSKYREGGLRDDHYMVACTLGNIEMAENVLNT